MPWDTVLIGLLWLIQPITAFIAGIVAYAALRDGLDWQDDRGGLDCGTVAGVSGCDCHREIRIPGLIASAASRPSWRSAFAVAISIRVIYRMGTRRRTVR